ncbi:YgaP family membrane protein [Hippea sp. KM1]|uniref:YgaP family membrane protein n=1 Tax=Hippea sp. KM1 TaxID=944481 RepID=UPI00046CB36E|nr:DUF2892 domain-containing protein [Hippea sp. KM1]
MKITKEANIGGKDREIRLLSGAALTTIGCLTKNHWIKAAGCILLITGISKKCIFYDLLGINTNT